MSKILIFGGTTEEHKIIEGLKNKHKLTLCVTGEYAASLAEGSGAEINVGRKDYDEIVKLIKKENYDIVIDATHPYAKVITENLKKATEEIGVGYYRIIREKSDATDCIAVNSIQEAADYLKKTDGNIMLTTGSKELKPFTEIENYAERIYPRVLPVVSSLEICNELGFLPSHIIAMQGPFSYETNKALFEQFNIKIMVTKDGGKAGGFPEKVKAADDMNIKTVLVYRDSEKGYTVDEIIKML